MVTGRMSSAAIGSLVKCGESATTGTATNSVTAPIRHRPNCTLGRMPSTYPGHAGLATQFSGYGGEFLAKLHVGGKVAITFAKARVTKDGNCERATEIRISNVAMGSHRNPMRQRGPSLANASGYDYLITK